MAARQWTSIQRAKQSQLIQNWKPWNNTSGARTPEGKAIVARNAFKGGVRPMLREISALLREQQQYLKRIK